jgi:hypothetical protein
MRCGRFCAVRCCHFAVQWLPDDSPLTSRLYFSRLHLGQKFVCIASSKASEPWFAAGPTNIVPALLTRISMSPSCSWTVSTTRSISARTPTSHANATSGDLLSANSSRTHSSSRSLLAQSATCAPACANSRANTRPQPTRPLADSDEAKSRRLT